MGYIRDYFFFMYQTNLIVGMGIVGGMIVALLVARALATWRPNRSPSQLLFWLSLAAFVTVLGIVVVGERDRGGLAHLTRQPLLLLGLTLLAASYSALPRVVRFGVIAGCVIDVGPLLVGAREDTEIGSVL